MDRTDFQHQITEGTDVFGSDGDKVGSIVAVQPNYVVVEKGFFFPTDYYIPTSAISRFDDGKLFLNVTKDAALNQGWDVVPVDEGYAPTTTVAGADAAMPETDVAAEARTTGETVRVPIHEEELTAKKRAGEIGKVRGEKDVVTEERTMDVPVTEERVRVERRVVDRPATAADEHVFEEGVVEVPIRGEQVDVEKQVRVAEEVDLEKDAVQRTEKVGGKVRREEVRVQEDIAEDMRATDASREADRRA